jgi:hypothetical protein
MYVRFNASESLDTIVQTEISNLRHYLRQPQRLVLAIADPQLTEQLSGDRFRLKVRPLSFMEIYRFQPTVVLRVNADSNGTVFLDSQECEIRGLEYIDRRFSLNLQGKLAPVAANGKTFLSGKADLEVKVELPPPLWIAPKPFLEMAGNSLLKSVLLRIKQRLASQLVEDYYRWLASENLDKTDPLVTSSQR